ncbi:hypothetical protein [Calidithermus chliarophilus]|uniref:hypothetical protein n=1 Tax=Calidithermus chliarophilus TaxID=52023 RepID=UPI000402A174|nr:hypothetical protein [Calidithermus chliarophilus]
MRLSPQNLVFDFDGWKLCGVPIGSPASRFDFLGPEDTPPEEVTLEPGFLGRLLGHRPRKELRDDEALVYRELGLYLECDGGTVCQFIFHIQPDPYLQMQPYPGRFVNGEQEVGLSARSTYDDVLALFPGGEGLEVEAEDSYIECVSGDYVLTFWFDEGRRLESVEALYDNTREALDEGWNPASE